ncbi:hypothetical protein [Pseudomonas sp. CC120222-01a]|uniref:hypothetical protein n=1 Tax=Pseudomonas sp. CC120222-01a TaxID=1378075 RepID=UPI000D9575FC|nr:hypothetical protein [Pseudomonas sp. CC120222-01a]PVZ41039.1 hypothetical protein N430_02549 [Pseudomonas sp. CC120222-01a]
MTTLVTAREYESYDEKIRAQAEMLTSLLSAGLQTQDAADKAVLALSRLQQEVHRQISSARNDLSNLADATATEAAKLLTEKFDQANEAAAVATKRYEKAGRLLGVKTFVTLVGALAVIGAAAWFLASPLLPSHEEIEFRRRQIAEMEAKAAVLAKKGVNLDWDQCKTGLLNRTKLCFRSDGEIYTREGTDQHYAVPHH